MPPRRNPRRLVTAAGRVINQVLPEYDDSVQVVQDDDINDIDYQPTHEEDSGDSNTPWSGGAPVGVPQVQQGGAIPALPQSPQGGQQQIGHVPDAALGKEMAKEDEGGNSDVIFAWVGTAQPNVDEPIEYHRGGWRVSGSREQVNWPVTRVTQVARLEREEWLRSDKDWSRKLGSAWVGIKVLGQGGFGIAGLWSKQRGLKPGSQHNVLGDIPVPGHVNDVVVKQQGRDLEGFRREGNIMEALSRTGSDHVLRLYHNVIEDQGRGTIRGVDGDEEAVGRLFLEYCSGGDLKDYTQKCYNEYKNTPIPERYIWEVLKCMAQGLAAMEHGSEVVDGTPWEEGTDEWNDKQTWQRENGELVHFDIKSLNVFVGTKDGAHLHTPICKIADFGLARKVEADPHEDNREGLSALGTIGYKPPEQFTSENGYRSNGCLPHIGKAMNIWQVGKAMYAFMFRGRNLAYSDQFYFRPKAASLRHNSSHAIPNWGESKMRNPIGGNTMTYGQLLLRGPYSGTLRSIILRCLAYDWRHRPSARQLIKLSNEAIAEFQRLETKSQDDLAAAAEAAER